MRRSDFSPDGSDWRDADSVHRNRERRAAAHQDRLAIIAKAKAKRKNPPPKSSLPVPKATRGVADSLNKWGRYSGPAAGPVTTRRDEFDQGQA